MTQQLRHQLTLVTAQSLSSPSLQVPVIKGADQKGVVEIAREVWPGEL